jgi:hypothetical protein
MTYNSDVFGCCFPLFPFHCMLGEARRWAFPSSRLSIVPVAKSEKKEKGIERKKTLNEGDKERNEAQTKVAVPLILPITYLERQQGVFASSSFSSSLLSLIHSTFFTMPFLPLHRLHAISPPLSLCPTSRGLLHIHNSFYYPSLPTVHSTHIPSKATATTLSSSGRTTTLPFPLPLPPSLPLFHFQRKEVTTTTTTMTTTKEARGRRSSSSWAASAGRVEGRGE